MKDKLKEQILEEFEDFMLEEYGKWKIGRIETLTFLNHTIDRVREENHPMLADNYRVETFDFQPFGGRVHKAIIRKDETKEQVEWVNVEILYSLLQSLTPLKDK